MSTRTQLSDIAITHISLVKAGANGKQVIYKSAADPGDGGYEHTIAIKKNDEEKGVIYGIVYAPDEVDSQGDFAPAEEIEKAAYGFMKARHTTNVDVDHSFEPEAAFVAESWIVKSGDAVFPDEPVGSWAVAIKLEDDGLKALAKSGELAGISMAGVAQKSEVKKEEGIGDKSFKNFFSVLSEVIGDVWIDFSAVVRKSKGGDMEKELNDFGAIVKQKLEEATRAAGEGLQKQEAKIAALTKSSEETTQALEAMQSDNDALKKENAALKKENEKLTQTIEAQARDIASLKEETAAVSKAVKESKQQHTVKKTRTKNDTKGTL